MIGPGHASPHVSSSIVAKEEGEGEGEDVEQAEGFGTVEGFAAMLIPPITLVATNPF